VRLSDGSVTGPDFSLAPISAVLARVREQVTKSKPASGFAAAAGTKASSRAPLHTADDLDTVAPNNPVWLMNTRGHYGAANS